MSETSSSSSQERFANIEKTIGIMLATNESEISTFSASDTPIARLLATDMPAVTNAKKDLDALMRRQESSQSALEREYKKLEKLKSAAEEDTDQDAVKSQQASSQLLPQKCAGCPGSSFVDSSNVCVHTLCRVQ